MYFMYYHCKFCVLGKEKLHDPTPETFTLFPLLPAELRLRIWHLIANTPRSVELTCTPTASHLPEGKWLSHSKSPVIFQICSESRAVALSAYTTLAFSPGQIGVPCSLPFRLNFSADTLWLCEDLHPAWARDLLEKNEQLKEELKFLVVTKKLWKELNEVELTSPLESHPPGTKEVVRKGLKAIQEIRFHS